MLYMRLFGTGQLPFRKRKFERGWRDGGLMVVNKISDMKPQVAEDLTKTEKQTLDLDCTAG